MLTNKYVIAIIISLSITASPTYAFIDVSGPAQLVQLMKILMEARARYQQLNTMINGAKKHSEYIKALNKGIENTEGLLRGLPVKDEGVLAGLGNFRSALNAISNIYGKIPESPEKAMHTLHDETVAESLKMVDDIKKYAKTQEENSNIIRIQSRSASPKGAARISAESNALLLESISQLIRLETQNLKLQSEILARTNKKDKSIVRNYQQVNKGLDKAFKDIKPTSKFIRI